jgi:hypothetical protein
MLDRAGCVAPIQHFRRLCMKRYVLAALATTMLFGATGAVRADDA